MFILSLCIGFILGVFFSLLVVPMIILVYQNMAEQELYGGPLESLFSEQKGDRN